MRGLVQKDDDIYRLELFIDHVYRGFFIDNDGHGEWATISYKFGIKVYPSELLKMTMGEIPIGATHIVWYNK